MAKRRTKKDRLRVKNAPAVKNSATLVSTARASTETVMTVKSSNAYLREIFNYDPKLIFIDLRRTLLIVMIILLILFAITLLYT